MTIKVSTILELIIFSRPVCELSGRREEAKEEDSPVGSKIFAKKLLLEEAMELVRGRCPRKDRVERDELAETLKLLEDMVEEVDALLPLDKEEGFVSLSSGIPSSHLRLGRAAVELVDGLRICLLDNMAPRSSIAPEAVKCDCSVGCVRAVVTASRTG